SFSTSTASFMAVVTDGVVLFTAPSSGVAYAL
ncbi:hypothetical protein A2U01_0109651, partial [Trifolium medium]|nr:hypothetical protein [Trifolium medium]